MAAKKRVNDPRDRDKSKDPVVLAGAVPGVGYSLNPGTKTIWGEGIDFSYNPWAHGPYPSLDMIRRRYGPSYAKGYRLKDSARQYLEGLWTARKVPGLPAQNHDTFTGKLTDREWYDFVMTEDPRVLRAWEALNGMAQVDPTVFDISAAFQALTAESQGLVKQLVEVLGRR